MMHLLSLKDLTRPQIMKIFRLADKLTLQNGSKILKGKTFILFFPQTSIRTRLTFEKGIKDLGGESILFPSETLDKEEKLEDVIQYIQNWADGVIVRHSYFSKIRGLTEHSSIPIINAMSSENHPCEILSDYYSISKIRKNKRDHVYTFVGPATNICRTWADLSKILDLKFYHVCQAGYEMGMNEPNYIFSTNLEQILKLSDIILTDSLPEELRTNEYINQYQITLERMHLAKNQALLNPCPPFFRNEEVSEEVISSPYFVGHAFKRNLLYVQQAIVLNCLGIEL